MPINSSRRNDAEDHAPARAFSNASLTRLTTLVTLLILTGCGSGMAPVAPEAPLFTVQGNQISIPSGSPLRAKIALAAVSNSTIAQDVVAPAVVEADPSRQYRILTPLSGRIAQLSVRLGDPVRPGQSLAVVASPDLSSAQADDARARAQLRLTGIARDRAIGLKSIGGGADKDVQQAQADFAAAQAEATRATTRLRQLGSSANMRSGGLALASPANGIVTDLAAAPGAFWTDPTASLMTINDISTVWITANVTENRLAAIHAGQKVAVTLAAYPDETITGEVQSVAPLLDPDTRRAKVRIAIPNANGWLKPGMFASANFAAPARGAPTVPTTALLLKDDATTVYAEVRPWTFERHVVETGAEQDGRTVITRGVAVGQRVIAKGGVLLDD